MQDRNSGIDVLRGVAVLLVMQLHMNWWALLGDALPLPPFLIIFLDYGWAGVDIFFVISAYLLTAGLLRHAGGSHLAMTATLFVIGMGQGAGYLSLLLIIQVGVARSELGTATGVSTLAKYVGGALGVGLLGSFVVSSGSNGSLEAMATPAMMTGFTRLFFAIAGLVFPLLLGLYGWRVASLVAAGAAVLTAIVVETLRSRLDVVVATGKTPRGIWRSIGFVFAHRELRVLGLSAVIYVVAQHTFTFYLVTYLYEHCRLSIAQAGFLLALSQMTGTTVRLVSGGMGDRVPRMKLLGWTGIGMTVGCIAISLLEADTPFWLILLAVVGYGSVVISWNGTSQAEFAHLSPPGEAAAIAAVQTALAFSGAVIGPPIFAAIASLVSYRAAFLWVAACVLVAAVWQIVAASRPRDAQSE